MHHNNWALALEPQEQLLHPHVTTIEALMPQGPVLHNKGSRHNEKLMHHNQGVASTGPTRESPHTAKKKKKTQHPLQSKINKF